MAGDRFKAKTDTSRHLLKQWSPLPKEIEGLRSLLEFKKIT